MKSLFEVDLSEFIEFENELKKLPEHFDEVSENVTKELAMRTISVLSVPVTQGGYTPVKDGNLIKSFYNTDIKRKGRSFVTHIKSDVQSEDGKNYANWIEEGHRIKRGGKVIGISPGFHMLKKSIEDVESEKKNIIDNELKKVLAKWKL